MLWELGCRKDGVRNHFIIPEVARILSATCPATILDVGAGTGYVARGVNGLLSYSPRWTMVDTSAERVALAGTLKPTMMIQEVIEADLLSLPSLGPHYDAALVTFTLLEVEDVAACVAHIWKMLTSGGVLIVALPDAWADILCAAETDPSLLERFLTERVSLSKHDKFTDKPYPFEAIRLESLIGIVLRAGFALEELKRSEASDAGVFLLSFRRRTAMQV